jgi:hypothetical protein
MMYRMCVVLPLCTIVYNSIHLSKFEQDPFKLQLLWY